MYVSLPPGCYASAAMCEEHSIVPFFFNFKSFVYGYIFFFAVIVNVTWCGSCFKSLFVCLFVFISGKRNTNLFTFSSISKYDGRLYNGYFTIRFLGQVSIFKKIFY